MSLSVDIHLWLGDNLQFNPLDIFGRVLEGVAVPQNVGYKGTRYNRFIGVKAFDLDSSVVCLDEVVNTNDVATVIQKLQGFVGPKFRYEVASVFDRLAYDDYTKTLEATVNPLTINYFGPEYGWKGLEYKSYGPIRIDFFNTKVFRVPQALIEQIKDVAKKRGDTTKWLRMPPQIGHNFEAVSGLAKRLILALDPIHLLVCTDLEVNPFTAHAIYHRDLQDYVEDLKKIARLHEYGGDYFCDVAPGEPAFIPTRKSPPSYGYLRDKYVAGTEDKFVEILQPMVDTILENPEMMRLSGEEIAECLTNMDEDSTVAEKINNSYYVSVAEPPWAYLEEPYFRLYEAIYDNTDRHEALLRVQ